MSNYTCITCHVSFTNSEIQRNHYKTDWHRYNLKRKVAELPPVTEDTFQERLLSFKAKDDESVDTSSFCKFCKKHFNCERTYSNHLQSKKHLELASRQSELDVLEQNFKNKVQAQLTSQKPDPKKEEKASNKLRNNKQSSASTVASNVPSGSEVMPKNKDLRTNLSSTATKKVIQGSDSENNDDDEDWEDEEDWEEVDGEPIGAQICLFCLVESMSLEENVKHMVDVHSFFIPDIEYLTDLEGFITYLGEKIGVGKRCLWCNEKGKSFYSVQSVQQHMIDKGHCKILHEGSTLAEFDDFYDYSSSYPDCEETATDEAVDLPVLDADDYQLVLPSGSVIGHRSLMRYYRQNIAPNRRADTQKAVDRMILQYRALGWTGTTGEAAYRHARDINYMRTIRDKHYMRLGVRHNKLQKHFRQQILF